MIILLMSLAHQKVVPLHHFCSLCIRQATKLKLKKIEGVKTGSRDIEINILQYVDDNYSYVKKSYKI